MNTQGCTNDAAGGPSRLDDVGFEVLIKVLGNTHCPKADGLTNPILTHFVELATDA